MCYFREMRRAGLKIAGVVVGVAVALFLVNVSRAEEEGVVEANAGDVVINEIMWMGSNTVGEADEWIELKNTTGDAIDLTGWSIDGAGTGVNPVITILSGTIPAGGYFLIGNYASSSSAISDAIAVDLATTGVSLANGGEVLTLRDARDVTNNVVDTTPAGAWEEGNNNINPTGQRNSMERNDVPGTGTAWSDWHTCLDDGCNDGVFWDVEEGNDYGTPTSSGISSVLPVPASPSSSPEEDEGGEGDEQQYSDEIIINEFLPNPIGSDTEGEFIELKNVGDEEVSLAGWRIDDEEGGSGAYVMPEGTVIEGGELVVFWRSETGLALNNEGDQVRLFSPDGEVKSSQQYDESVAEGVARARDEEGTWQWSTTPTPGQPNVITLPEEEETEDGEEEDATYSDAIAINEFLPNPTGSDTAGEFVELKNTGSEEVSLAGWRLDDEEGGSSPYKIPAGVSLAGGDYYVFWRSDTKLALNNDGEEVRLFDPAGNIKSSFVYEESVAEAVSYNRTDSGEYVLSTTVTPGGDNVITEPVSEDGEGGSDKSGGVAGAVVTKVLLKDIRGQTIGTVVETEGVVSVPPGVLGDKIMYVAGSGIQIYFYQEEYPELEAGNRVKVKGELTTSLGEYRIKLAAADDILVVGEGTMPEPHQARTGEVGEGWEGSLVVVAGRVTRTSGDTFYIDDGSGEIKVFIKATTGIDKPKMKKGAVVTIAGVVSRTNTGYRILPRWQQDVRLGLVAGLASFPGAGWLPGPLGVAGLVAGLALVLARRAGEPLLGV